MSASLEGVYRRSPKVVGRRIGDQFVLVPIARGVADVDSLFTLNKMGAFLWERFDGVRDGNAHLSSAVEAFDVTTERAAGDYLVFVSQLLEIGALEAVAGE